MCACVSYLPLLSHSQLLSTTNNPTLSQINKANLKKSLVPADAGALGAGLGGALGAGAAGAAGAGAAGAEEAAFGVDGPGGGGGGGSRAFSGSPCKMITNK